MELDLDDAGRDKREAWLKETDFVVMPYAL